MTNVLKMSRKAFTISVVALTVAWSIGLSALLAPLASSAATSGQLIKGSLSAVYYMGSDGKRYVFPNEKTYFTWYSDFSGVMTITDAELASYPIGGNVTYRPGVMLVKIQSDPKVYAVDAGGTLRWVKSEAAAVSLYGSDWNTMDTHDVSDAFFTNYTVGADINSSADFNPAAATAAATSINQDKGLASGSVAAGLSASKASDSPAGATLPLGATGVNFLKFNVSNGGSSAQVVSSVTVHRSGPGAPGDFANVYLYQGADRLTTGRSINSSSNEATFSGLNLSVPAGSSVSLMVTADIATGAAAGNVHALGVTSVMVGGQSVAGAPFTGSNFTLAAAAVGTVTISRQGSNPLADVKSGELQAKVAEFQIAAGAAEDLDLTSIALFQAGNISRENLTNFTLKQAGLTLATAAGVNSKDLVVFTLSSPMFIEKGNTRNFIVYADVSGSSRSADTIRFHLDQTTDVKATGRTYGYGARVINTAYNNSDGDGTDQSRTTIESGQVNITFNGPASKDIAQNGKDVELLNYTLTAQANLEVRTTTILLACTTCVVTEFTDVKIVDTATGAIVAGPATGAATLTYNETYNLSSGQSRTFKVTADVENTTSDNDKIVATLQAFGASHVRNLDNSTFLATTDFVPSTDVAGNTHTVRVPSLTVSGASTPTAQTYIQGTQGASLAGVTLQAGNASDVTVSSITLTGQIDSHTAADDCTGAPNGVFAVGREHVDCNSVASLVQTAALWNGSTQVGQTKSPSSSPTAASGGLLVFDNLNLTVPKGQSVTLHLKGNLAGGQTAANMPDDVRFNVAASSITATDADGNTVAQTGTTTGNTMRVANAGTLTVALAPDDSESEAGLVIGGSSNTTLAKYRFTAVNEELKLVKQRIRVTTSANAVGLTSLSLYDGATLVAGPKSVGGTGITDFSDVNFVIPKDSSKTLTVKGNLNSVGAGGATSGLDVAVSLEVDDEFEVRGTGTGSSTLITDGGDDVNGRSKVLRKTKPTISLVALPNSTLSASTLAVMRFTITADSAGDVAIKGIDALIAESIDSAAATINEEAAGNSSIRRVGDGTNLAGTSDVQDTAAVGGGTCLGDDGTCWFKSVFATEEVIAAGTSRTYDIRLTIGGTIASGDSISVSLLGDTAVVTGEVDYGAGAAPHLQIDDLDGTDGTAEFNFVWSDMSSVPHDATVDADLTTDDATTSNDWTNGRFVKVLPTDTQTMSR